MVDHLTCFLGLFYCSSSCSPSPSCTDLSIWKIQPALSHYRVQTCTNLSSQKFFLNNFAIFFCFFSSFKCPHPVHFTISSCFFFPIYGCHLKLFYSFICLFAVFSCYYIYIYVYISILECPFTCLYPLTKLKYMFVLSVIIPTALSKVVQCHKFLLG